MSKINLFAAIKMRQSGMKVQEIADHFQVSRDAVYKVLSKKISDKDRLNWLEQNSGTGAVLMKTNRQPGVSLRAAIDAQIKGKRPL